MPIGRCNVRLCSSLQQPRILASSIQCKRRATSDKFAAAACDATSNNDSVSSNTPRPRRARPLVHLSSAIGQKYEGKEIGSPYPVIPHDLSPVRYVADKSISVPWYADKSISADDCRYELKSEDYYDNDINTENARYVGKLTRRALELAVSLLKPDNTTDSIDALVRDYIISEGAYPSFLLYRGYPKSICTSTNEIMYLGIPDFRPLEAGDVVSVSVACYLNDAHAKVCDTMVVEGSSNDDDDSTSITSIEKDSRDERSRRLTKATKEALDEAVAVCRPGRNISDIGTSIQSVADAYDYRVAKSWKGHGIGHELHCLPEFKHYRNNDTTVLEPGMMLAIEPILVEGHAAHAQWSNGYTACTVDGGMAAQSGHTVFVSEDGAELLTK